MDEGADRADGYPAPCVLLLLALTPLFMHGNCEEDQGARRMFGNRGLRDWMLPGQTPPSKVKHPFSQASPRLGSHGPRNP